MGVRGRCGSGEGEGFGVGAGEVGLGVDLGAVDFDGDGVLVFGLLAVEGHADKGWDVGDFAVGVEECFGVGASLGASPLQVAEAWTVWGLSG